MLLLDTHALYWWVNRTPDKLGRQQLDAIETAESLAVSLPEHHKDPADRIIIAKAVEHQARLVSVDGRFPAYQELAELLV